MKVSAAEIEAGRTAAGGWSRSRLAAWGVSWPPARGWKRALLKGDPVPKRKRKVARKRGTRHGRGGSYWDRQWRDAMARDEK